MNGSTECKANEVTIIDVTFKKQFEKIPVVVATVKTNSPSLDMAHITLSVDDITVSGFKIRVYNGASSSRWPMYSWMAILK